MKNENSGTWLLPLILILGGLYQKHFPNGFTPVLEEIGEVIMKILTLILWLAGSALALWLAYLALCYISRAWNSILDWARQIDTSVINHSKKIEAIDEKLYQLMKQNRHLIEDLRAVEQELRAIKTHTGLEAKEAVEDVTKEFV